MSRPHTVDLLSYPAPANFARGRAIAVTPGSDEITCADNQLRNVEIVFSLASAMTVSGKEKNPALVHVYAPAGWHAATAAGRPEYLLRVCTIPRAKRPPAALASFLCEAKAAILAQFCTMPRPQELGNGIAIQELQRDPAVEKRVLCPPAPRRSITTEWPMRCPAVILR